MLSIAFDSSTTARGERRPPLPGATTGATSGQSAKSIHVLSQSSAPAKRAALSAGLKGRDVIARGDAKQSPGLKPACLPSPARAIQNSKQRRKPTSRRRVLVLASYSQNFTFRFGENLVLERIFFNNPALRTGGNMRAGTKALGMNSGFEASSTMLTLDRAAAWPPVIVSLPTQMRAIS